MYDVVIIGAGPAGLSAAIACRESNLHVLIMMNFQNQAVVSLDNFTKSQPENGGTASRKHEY